jgi:hypothetical protein
MLKLNNAQKLSNFDYTRNEFDFNNLTTNEKVLMRKWSIIVRTEKKRNSLMNAKHGQFENNASSV